MSSEHPVALPSPESTTLMTTHKVVIDANDEAHARWLAEALTNDGYSVSRETHRLVQCDEAITIERTPA